MLLPRSRRSLALPTRTNSGRRLEEGAPVVSLNTQVSILATGRVSAHHCARRAPQELVPRQPLLTERVHMVRCANAFALLCMVPGRLPIIVFLPFLLSESHLRSSIFSIPFSQSLCSCFVKILTRLSSKFRALHGGNTMRCMVSPACARPELRLRLAQV